MTRDAKVYAKVYATVYATSIILFILGVAILSSI